MLAARSRLTKPRHPGDAVRLVTGLAILVLSAELVQRHRVGVLETNTFRLVNDLPGQLYTLFWLPMQAGNLIAVPLAAAAAALLGRFRLALDLGVAGSAAWLLAKLVKHVRERGRPPDLLGHVHHLHGQAATGLGYVSGHAAVAVALATVASPYLGRRARRIAWVVAVLVCLARLYVGAHLPLDVIGGAALGWATGALVHLLLGAPGGRPSPARARRALVACGFEPVEVEPLGGPDDRRSARFLAGIATGGRLFVKLIPRERRDGDLLYRAWRRLLRGVSRPGPRAGPPREQVEREAYLALLASSAGVRTPAVVFAGPCDNDAGLLVQHWVPGNPLDQRQPDEIDDELLRAVWREVARLQEAGIAHGDLSRASIVVDERELPWLVDFDRAEAIASQDLLAVDVAELLASLAVRLGPERPVAAAVEVLGAAAVAGALRSARPVALTHGTRAELRGHPGLWEALLGCLPSKRLPDRRLPG